MDGQCGTEAGYQLTNASTRTGQPLAAPPARPPVMRDVRVRKLLKYTVVFWCVTAVCAYEALALGGWATLLLWPGISFAFAGAAYAGVGPRVFGKRSDGSLAMLATGVLLPYLLYTWLLWHLWRLCTREDPYHVLFGGVKVGRRLLPHEFPKDVTEVFDLTAEFAEPTLIREKGVYRCYPTLDATQLEPDVLFQAARQVLDAAHGAYIHCANGHGRTGTLAGAVLLLAGRVQTAEEALEYLVSRRPRIRLNRHQYAALLEFAKTSASEAGEL